MRIGIDLGGTKIEGVVLDENNIVKARIRRPTPHDSYAEIVGLIVELVKQLEREVSSNCSVGIGTPGAISPHTGRIKNSNTVVLNGRNLKADLQQAIGKPLLIANDANCLALSESVDGAAAGAQSVFGVIIGTGTGGGLVINGRVVSGANAIAGEWGHNPLPVRDAIDEPCIECYCGEKACIETYLCGAGLSRLHRFLGGGEESAEHISAQAGDGDRLALNTVDVYAQRLARALASVINIVDPEVVVFGGGLSKLPSLTELLDKHLPRFVFSDHVATKMKIALHGDTSGVRGAAWLPPA